MMMAAKNKNQSGQALIELIVFLPLMFGLYAMISGFANAINGSINQQKVTRGYLYYRLQNNSHFPKPSAVSPNWEKFSMQIMGWRENFINGKQPVMPCYKVSLPMTPTSRDTCEASYTDESTQFIRVGTVVGLCGATYQRVGSTIYHVPDGTNGDYRGLVDASACTNQ